MGDTACVVVHVYSYASSPTPSATTSIHGNAKHALGESISFGRFMTDDEPLSWEKWSIFSHKKYVEEAERYAQPGSVAQKKAFFEAHYKKIADQKAAALLEQQNEKSVGYSNDDNNNNNNASKSDVDVKMEEVKIQDSKSDDDGMNINEHSSNSIAAVDNGIDGENAASIKSNVAGNTEKSRPAKRRPASSKYLRTLMNLVLFREPDGDPISAAKKTESSPKDCSTDTASSTEGVSYTQSDNKRMKIPRSKTGPKWHILSAVCSKSTRTEEGTAIREKEKTRNKGFRKLTCSFCFKVVDSYSDGETPRNQTSAIQPPRPAESKRSNSNKMDVSISVPPPPPPPPPPPTCSVKNSPSKNLSKI